MNSGSVFQVAAAVLLSLGGASAVILGLSNFLGKIWAERLMSRESAEHARQLEVLRNELTRQAALDLEQIRVGLDLAKSKLMSAHQDKVALYRMVTDVLVPMVTDIVVIVDKNSQAPQADKVTRILQFERDRLKAYAYVAMFAPQSVMDSFDHLTDYLLDVVDGTKIYAFGEVRSRGIEMLNAIRLDLGLDPSPIAYRGSRQ